MFADECKPFTAESRTQTIQFCNKFWKTLLEKKKILLIVRHLFTRTSFLFLRGSALLLFEKGNFSYIIFKITINIQENSRIKSPEIISF